MFVGVSFGTIESPFSNVEYRLHLSHFLGLLIVMFMSPLFSPFTLLLIRHDSFAVLLGYTTV